ncbi:protein-disulfide reductase DsbD family protein [Thermopirellula anaerolimosa]
MTDHRRTAARIRNGMLIPWLATVVLSVLFPHLSVAQFSLSPGGGGLFGTPKVRVKAAFTEATSTRPALLFVQAEIDPGWHIYSVTQTGDGPRPTIIRLKPDQGVRVASAFVPDRDPERKTEAAFPGIEVETHDGAVWWVAAIAIDPNVDVSKLAIQGVLNAQPCDASSCLPPQDLPFTAARVASPPIAEDVLAALLPTLLAGGSRSGDQPPAASDSSTGDTAKPTPSTAPQGGLISPIPEDWSGDDLPWQPFTMRTFLALVGDEFDPDAMQANVGFTKWSWQEFVLKILAGFLGGIILNVMPCVLPVIGLKLLSFIQTAGEDRRRAFALNAWYSAGLLSIFLLLAILAVFLKLGWGYLFKFAEFNVVMAAIVFAMALAFLGVWSIPIPGFVGSGKAVELAQKEGAVGAFLKGVLTTILATPCTGPFMGAALAWAFSQPPSVVFAVFMSVGLGMASPYLVVGAFPELMRFMPKPGPWMESFERVMGFVLLGTVVYIFTYLDWPYLAPTLGLLFAIWAALWWVERTGFTASSSKKFRAWLEAAAFVAVMWLLLFPGIRVDGRQWGGLLSVMEHRFLRRATTVVDLKLFQEGKQIVSGDQAEKPIVPPGKYTILVDCTADWCVNCKTLEATVLNTEPVRRILRENKVVLLQADWTHESPEVTRFLNWLGFQQVPVVVVFPAGRPNEPFVFTGMFTQRDIVQAVEKAGPSVVAQSRGESIETVAATSSGR